MSQKNQTAIVMGGSVAGMWTARVLADHFDQVFLLERDSLPDGPEARAGVPQSRQYHIMLLRGLQIMDELFPGLRDELIRDGAVPFDTINDVSMRSRNIWLPQFPSGQIMLSCSRLLIEAGLRRRLRGFAQVRFVENVEVTGLETDAQNQRMTGVHIKQLRDGDRPAGSTDILYADLVVDALGRRSPTPRWLTELGYAAPTESVVDSFLGYVTRRYRQPDNFQADWRMLLLGATPPDQPRGGLIFPEENGVWTVMLAGVNKEYPPTDEAGFDEFARSLGPKFYNAVQAAEPISKAYGYRGTDSTRRHYEKLTRWPDRYVVLGDSFCGFNPIYGQGMTVSGLSAQALGGEIEQAGGNLNGVAQRTLSKIGAITDGAWLLATSADLEWPLTVGGTTGQTLANRFGSWYISQLVDSLARDQVLRLAFLDVTQLIKPVTHLFAPRFMMRVFRHAWGPKRQMA